MKWSYDYHNRRRVKTYSAPAGPISGFFMVMAGIALLCGAGWTGKNTHELLTQGIHTDGKVVNVTESLEKKSRTRNGYTEHYEELRYRYVVEFEDKAGKKLQFKDSQSTDYRKYAVGDALPVIYLEKDPRGTATLDHGVMNWILPGALGFFGVLMCVFGGAAALRKSAPPAAPPGTI